MKENSEEDIKNIEEIIELSKEEIDAKDENITAILDIEDLISLEHILSAYKRVLKENDELKKLIAHKNAYTKMLEKDLFENCSNYVISRQKIKDKIEYLEDYIEKNSDEQGYWGNINPDVIYEQIEILKEILKESEE